MATPVPLPSFDFLGCPLRSGEGMGAIPAFLEFSSPRGPAGVQLPRLWGVSLHARWVPLPFPLFPACLDEETKPLLSPVQGSPSGLRSVWSSCPGPLGLRFLKPLPAQSQSRPNLCWSESELFSHPDLRSSPFLLSASYTTLVSEFTSLSLSFPHL